MTPLKVVFDAFFDQVTDDMYLEMSKEETMKDCKGLLYASLPLYEFPKQIINITVDENGIDVFSRDLNLEEINILVTGMIEIWLQRQINNIELTRQKFSGADFKISSQASHLNRLISLLQATKDEHRRLQMLESRRRETRDGRYESAFDLLVKRK